MSKNVYYSEPCWVRTSVSLRYERSAFTNLAKGPNVGYRLTYCRCSCYIIPFRYYDFFVTSQGFEPRLSGPKPLVLPLDEEVICRCKWIRTTINGFGDRYSTIELCTYKRKVRDSNSRTYYSQRFSRPSHSTALPTFQKRSDIRVFISLGPT